MLYFVLFVLIYLRNIQASKDSIWSIDHWPDEPSSTFKGFISDIPSVIINCQALHYLFASQSRDSRAAKIESYQSSAGTCHWVLFTDKDANFLGLDATKSDSSWLVRTVTSKDRCVHLTPESTNTFPKTVSCIT